MNENYSIALFNKVKILRFTAKQNISLKKRVDIVVFFKEKVSFE